MDEEKDLKRGAGEGEDLVDHLRMDPQWLEALNTCCIHAGKSPRMGLTVLVLPPHSRHAREVCCVERILSECCAEATRITT